MRSPAQRHALQASILSEQFWCSWVRSVLQALGQPEDLHTSYMHVCFLQTDALEPWASSQMQSGSAGALAALLPSPSPLGCSH